jgi:hypothetical protein
MSDIFQPGLTMDQAHPDADQLTAFAEHALPPHEQQQTLAHLATCADCRQIVFLAQQAVEMEAIEPLPMRIRKPWFAGWNLVLPAMLAVAGIVAFSLYLRNFSKPATRLDAVTTAQVEPQSPPVAPVPAAAIERPAEEPSPSATPRKKESIAPPTPNALAPTAEAKATTPIVIGESVTGKGSSAGSDDPRRDDHPRRDGRSLRGPGRRRHTSPRALTTWRKQPSPPGSPEFRSSGSTGSSERIRRREGSTRAESDGDGTGDIGRQGCAAEGTTLNWRSRATTPSTASSADCRGEPDRNRGCDQRGL